MLHHIYIYILSFTIFHHKNYTKMTMDCSLKKMSPKKSDRRSRFQWKATTMIFSAPVHSHQQRHASRGEPKAPHATSAEVGIQTPSRSDYSVNLGES